MKKMILKGNIHDEKARRKALKAVSSLSGVESISFDSKDDKLTVIGGVDPIRVVEKLRKVTCAEIVSVGPKEDKKEGGKKDGDKKDDDVNKAYEAYRKAYEAYFKHPYPYYCPPYYRVVAHDEYPDNCFIC